MDDFTIGMLVRFDISWVKAAYRYSERPPILDRHGIVKEIKRETRELIIDWADGATSKHKAATIQRFKTYKGNKLRFRKNSK